MPNHIVEKDNYHESIFYKCSNLIRKVDPNNKDINFLCKALEETANTIGRYEYEVISLYNSNSNQGLFFRLNRFVKDLLTERIELSLVFLTSTSKYITDQIFKDNKIDLNIPNFKDRMYHLSKLNNPPLFIDKGLEENFIRFYEIISYIVEDITNMKGWKKVASYYKTAVLPKKMNEEGEIDVPITFLSYAFKDNIYALFLFDLFDKNGGFLYVDSLFGEDYHGDGVAIKESLSSWIKKSKQILFLHSIHSNRIRNKLSSWCSWELGQAYRYSSKKFYRVIVAGIDPNRTHPIVLDFKELKSVKNGIINPKRKKSTKKLNYNRKICL